MNRTPDTDPVDALEILVNRVIDAEDSEAEWTALMVEADRSPSIWRDLACRQRDARRLMRAVERRATVASTATLPPSPVSEPVNSPTRAAVRRTGRGADIASPWGRALGWAAAACIVLAWAISGTVGPSATTGADAVAIQVAGVSDRRDRATALSSGLSSDQILDAYLEAGRREGVVVGELPTKYLLDSRRLEFGGGFEVLFVRPIVERRVVPALYGFDESDDGSPRVVPVGDGAI